jgi:hypothetical protein
LQGGEEEASAVATRWISVSALKSAEALTALGCPPDGGAAGTRLSAPDVPSLLSGLLSAVFGKIGTSDKSIFSSSQGEPSIKCYNKVNEGALFPLRRAFVWLGKPLLVLPLSTIAEVKVARGGGAARTFDIDIKPLDGKVVNFSMLDVNELAPLTDYVSTRTFGRAEAAGASAAAPPTSAAAGASGASSASVQPPAPAPAAPARNMNEDESEEEGEGTGAGAGRGGAENEEVSESEFDEDEESEFEERGEEDEEEEEEDEDGEAAAIANEGVAQNEGVGRPLKPAKRASKDVEDSDDSDDVPLAADAADDADMSDDELAGLLEDAGPAAGKGGAAEDADMGPTARFLARKRREGRGGAAPRASADTDEEEDGAAAKRARKNERR